MTKRNPTRITFYVVRAENEDMPESYLCGVYPTQALAESRCETLQENYDNVWYDTVEMGPQGGDCMECNR